MSDSRLTPFPGPWAENLQLPAMLDNQKIRRAVLRLFGEDPRSRDFTKKLHHHQGLLQIYEDFCLEDDSACADCPFPERLKEGIYTPAQHEFSF